MIKCLDLYLDLQVESAGFLKNHCMAAPGLCCCVRAFSEIRSKRGLLSGGGAWASYCEGFSCCGAQL